MLFKSEIGEQNQETAIVSYIEGGKTKTAVFRNGDCSWRAKQKARRLTASGKQVLYVQGVE